MLFFGVAAPNTFQNACFWLVWKLWRTLGYPVVRKLALKILYNILPIGDYKLLYLEG